MQLARDMLVREAGSSVINALSALKRVQGRLSGFMGSLDAVCLNISLTSPKLY